MCKRRSSSRGTYRRRCAAAAHGPGDTVRGGVTSTLCSEGHARCSACTTWGVTCCGGQGGGGRGVCECGHSGTFQRGQQPATARTPGRPQPPALSAAEEPIRKSDAGQKSAEICRWSRDTCPSNLQSNQATQCPLPNPTRRHTAPAPIRPGDTLPPPPTGQYWRSSSCSAGRRPTSDTIACSSTALQAWGRGEVGWQVERGWLCGWQIKGVGRLRAGWQLAGHSALFVVAGATAAAGSPPPTPAPNCMGTAR